MSDRKKNTLILTQTDPKKDIMFQQWLNEGLNADLLFKKAPKLLRAIRRIWLYYNLPFSIIWFGDWIRRINNYNHFIIHASEMTGTVASWIHHFNPTARIIYWYWNPVNKYSNPYRVKDKNVEFWTFDAGDAEKYHMQKNIQYYCPPIPYKSGESNIRYDVYFIGHDKGRKQEINNFKKILDQYSISHKIRILKDNDFFPYSKVFREIQQCKAILEINQSGQKGLTLRALESLFLSKKLITTNSEIKKVKFYNSRNIFVIGKDNIQEIKKFVDSPYDHETDQYKKEYNVQTWFYNFFKSKTC